MFKKHLLWGFLPKNEKKVEAVTKELVDEGLLNENLRVTKKGMEYLNSQPLNFEKIVKNLSYSAIIRLMYICIKTLVKEEQFDAIEELKTNLENRSNEDWD